MELYWSSTNPASIPLFHPSTTSSSISVNGLVMPNPFVIGSGPPETNYTVMKRAFDEGWGAVIAKTVSLDAAKVINVIPRYARLSLGGNGSAKGQIIGWENIELISDRPLEIMLKEFKQLKEEYPNRVLIASIMEEYDKAGKNSLTELSKLGLMQSKLIFHVLTVCQNVKWELQSGKIVHYWKRFVWNSIERERKDVGNFSDSFL